MGCSKTNIVSFGTAHVFCYSKTNFCETFMYIKEGNITKGILNNPNI